MALETLYTVKEVAGILRVNRKTIYNWIDQGKIRAVKFTENQKNRYVRIPESAINKFIVQNETVQADTVQVG